MALIERETVQRLKELQTMAIDHAAEELQAAHALSLNTKQERGDRYWFTTMCARSLAVAYRVEQFMAMREYYGYDKIEDEETRDKKEREFIKRAELQLKKIMATAKPTDKPKAKSKRVYEEAEAK